MDGDGRPVFGWDIGGAHLKVAVAGDARIAAVRQIPCRLWEGLDRLEEAFATALDGLPAGGRHAITMTGELVDLFPDRAHGVAALLAAATARLGDDLRVWAGEAGFLSPAEAARQPAGVASANWSATASLVARSQVDALVVDIGSTTADLVPVRGGRVAARGQTDRERLAAGELVYTGLTRTPVMALAPALPWRGAPVPLMAEYFATTADVHRLLGTLPEDADQHAAADNGPKTVEASARRLGRMIGVDLDEAELPEWRSLAAAAAEKQLQAITGAAQLVLSAAALPVQAPLIGAGAGRAMAGELARRLGRPYADIASLVACDGGTADSVARCAPAVAVALLAG